MMLHKFVSIFAILTLGTSMEAFGSEVKVMHLQMGGGYHRTFIQELTSAPTAQGETVTATLIPTPRSSSSNPFHITGKNWDFGEVFNGESTSTIDSVPIAPLRDLQWFRKARENSNFPDLMIISGHHIPGIGWHSDDTWNDTDYFTRSLMLSSLLRLRRENAEARAFFDNVKFVFISGCWGLVNMEPHGPKGEFLSPDQIFEIYASGAAGQSKMKGNPSQFYSLQAQRWELTTLYGGDFSDGPDEESCEGNSCVTYNVHRVMSDDGLMDGSHRYNQPLSLRRLFPNAAVIFGFHSPSPYNETVKVFIRRAFARAKNSPLLMPQDLPYRVNLLHSIVDNQTPKSTKARLAQAFREAWTTVTWEQNKGSMPQYWGGRPGASISPAFPELDNDSVFAWPSSYQNPSFAPRCLQYRPDAVPCQIARPTFSP